MKIWSCMQISRCGSVRQCPPPPPQVWFSAAVPPPQVWFSAAVPPPPPPTKGHWLIIRLGVWLWDRKGRVFFTYNEFHYIGRYTLSRNNSYVNVHVWHYTLILPMILLIPSIDTSQQPPPPPPHTHTHFSRFTHVTCDIDQYMQH